VATGASVDILLITLPLMESTLPGLRRVLKADPKAAPWWAYWNIDRDRLRQEISVNFAQSRLFSRRN
jgi:hypothetical protein